MSVEPFQPMSVDIAQEAILDWLRSKGHKTMADEFKDDVAEARRLEVYFNRRADRLRKDKKIDLAVNLEKAAIVSNQIAATAFGAQTANNQSSGK